MSTHLDRRTLIKAAIGAGAMAAAAQSTGMVSAATPSWQLLSDGQGPSPRWDHTLVADDESKQLLLFGGRDANFAALADTWIYSLSDREWRQIDGDGPPARFGQAVAVDQQTHEAILFGGETAEVFYNDVWVFDFTDEQWSQVDAGDTIAPAPRYGLGAVLDEQGRLLISHGFTFEGRFDDTWAFDRTSGGWSDISPSEGGARPLKRCLHEQVWDADAGRMLLYGGCSSGFGPCPQGDLWSYDPEEGTWTELTPASSPPPRTNPALVLDPRGTRSLLIGGLTDAGYAADVWALTVDDGVAEWTNIVAEGTAPAPRASHDAVLTRGDIYLFGGTGAAVFGDLWKLNLT